MIFDGMAWTASSVFFSYKQKQIYKTTDFFFFLFFLSHVVDVLKRIL